MFVLGMLGVLFSIFNYFRSPQIKTEKNEALLSQRVQWVVEATDRRFKEMQDSFRELVLQSNNHIHTVDTKVEALGAAMNDMSVQIAKLSTTIEERIPRKN